MVENRQKLKMSGKEFFSKIRFEFFPSLSSENFQKRFFNSNSNLLRGKNLNSKKVSSGKKMSDSEEEEEEIPGTSQLVLETFTTTRPKTNPRLEHFKNIIRQNQGKTKFLSQILSFIKKKFSPRFLAKKSREKKSGSLSKNPSGKKFGEMTMKFSTT